MKEILDEESRKALIAYRLQRAYETLKEAEVMIRESFYNAASVSYTHLISVYRQKFSIYASVLTELFPNSFKR